MQDIILDKVKNFIYKHNLINYGDKVLIALSGGADSMALTNILLSLSNEIGFSICAAHLNHSLRNIESDYDEKFVTNYCNQNNIDFVSEKINVSEISIQLKMGIEEAARSVRYDFLTRTAISFGANKIATAHTLSDNAESLILNITRGCGLSGITGIPEKRGNIIRPILCLTRQEVEDFNKSFSIPFVTDSTNSNTDYTRNYIRKEIIPRLKSINPSFLFAVDRLITSTKEDNEFIISEAYKLIDNAKINKNIYDVNVLSSAPKPVLKHALSILFNAYTNESIAFSNLNSLYSFVVSDQDGFHQLPLGKFAHKEFGRFNFVDTTERKVAKRFFITADEYNILPDNRKVIITRDSNCNDKLHYFDADKISGDLIIRLKNSFDCIKLYKRPNKSLKKLFNEMRIPVEDRDSAIILCDDAGVIWVDNIGVAERVMVDNESKNIYKITIEE